MVEGDEGRCSQSQKDAVSLAVSAYMYPSKVCEQNTRMASAYYSSGRDTEELFSSCCLPTPSPVVDGDGGTPASAIRPLDPGFRCMRFFIPVFYV